MALADVEIGRALNALATTLNDQKAQRVDLDRFRAIVTGSMGGEPHADVHAEAGGGDHAAWLQDRETGERVGEVWLEDGRWLTNRTRDARSSHAYIPSAG